MQQMSKNIKLFSGIWIHQTILGLTGDEMWKRLEQKLSNGSIILSHNGTKHTADSLEMLVHNIKNKGYDIVSVSELIHKENYTIDANGVQKRQKAE